MITLELTPELVNNLQVLVMAGAKNPATGIDGILGGAQILQLVAQAVMKSQKTAEGPPQKPNGATDAMQEHIG